ncbi:hypothetical protein EI555_020113 [Monodon monoceros]|uniref:Cytochrome b n=1 Tax=Monodon monoceros TaxID=40151 RepID=A0A4U1EXL4_MONMO|nr:hypothetical protein EI555_020113 [Monodon monoceros]
MMRSRFHLFSITNLNGLIPSNTLHIRHNNAFSSVTHICRDVNYGTRLLLWILYFFRNMKHWNHLIIYSHGHSIYRLCLTLRTNTLRGNIDKATLTRFFAFHFILPFIITALTAVPLLFLHETGSNSPTGISSDVTKFHFTPTIQSKTSSKPSQNTTHIKPDWYFLFAYAVLRSIPNKLGGVLALIFSVLILPLIPMLRTSRQRSITF